MYKKNALSLIQKESRCPWYTLVEVELGFEKANFNDFSNLLTDGIQKLKWLKFKKIKQSVLVEL
jgi:hypothetical protein